MTYCLLWGLLMGVVGAQTLFISNLFVISKHIPVLH